MRVNNIYKNGATNLETQKNNIVIYVRRSKAKHRSTRTSIITKLISTNTSSSGQREIFSVSIPCRADQTKHVTIRETKRGRDNYEHINKSNDGARPFIIRANNSPVWGQPSADPAEINNRFLTGGTLWKLEFGGSLAARKLSPPSTLAISTGRPFSDIERAQVSSRP